MIYITLAKMDRMTQTQKTEWITELAACRYKVLMRDYKGAPYKSAAVEAWERRKSIMRKKMSWGTIL
jgi:hypothetical protein